jgi:hypothetical protein
MLATLASPSILDALRYSIGTLFEASCCTTETVADRLAGVPSGRSDCVTDTSTGSASYATCLESDSTFLVHGNVFVIIDCLL